MTFAELWSLLDLGRSLEEEREGKQGLKPGEQEYVRETLVRLVGPYSNHWYIRQRPKTGRLGLEGSIAEIHVTPRRP